MAVFKIFAVLFVVCIVQNVASAGTLRWDKPAVQDDSELTAETLRLERNSFGCIAHIYEAYNVAQEVRGLWTKFKEIQESDILQKFMCDKKEQDAEKQKCIKEVNDATTAKISQLLDEIKETLPKVVSVLAKFKACLFD